MERLKGSFGKWRNVNVNPKSQSITKKFSSFLDNIFLKTFVFSRINIFLYFFKVVIENNFAEADA